MVAARGRKAPGGLAARGFSLVEVLFTTALLSGVLLLLASGFAGRFADPRPDERVAAEVAEVVAWLDDLLYRAEMAGKNFEIAAPTHAPGVLSVKWQGESEREEWRSERICVRVFGEGARLPSFFRYDWRTHALTPALTLRVFTQKRQYAAAAEWFIIVSGHGLTRASQSAP